MLPYIFVVFIIEEFKRYFDGKLSGSLKEELRYFRSEYIETEKYDIDEEEEYDE